MKSIIRKLVVTLIKILSVSIPVNRKKIVFMSSYRGTSYSGNPRAIYEKMVQLGLDKQYNCYWVFLENVNNYKVPGNAVKINYKSLSFIVNLARAKFWVFEADASELLFKKKNQVYIQTWHGTPLKKLGLDVDHYISLDGKKGIDDYKKSILRESERWDYLVVQNDFSENTFRRCFGYKNKIIHSGYPRNDYLFEYNNLVYINEVKEKYNLPLDKKIILYAPTFRDDQIKDGVRYFDLQLDLNYIEKELSNEYCIVIKCHYLVKRIENLSCDNKDFYRIADKDVDIKDLYLASDILVTDYSSVMFDFALLNKPMYFFCYDIDNYEDNLRGFYFNFIEESPGPICKNNKDLLANLRLSNNEYFEEYGNRVTAFKNKYSQYDSGSASKAVIEIIKKKS